MAPNQSKPDLERNLSLVQGQSVPESTRVEDSVSKKAKSEQQPAQGPAKENSMKNQVGPPVEIIDGEKVIEPSLQVDGSYSTHADCDGCYNRLYGTRYKCQECQDFDFCSTCMESQLQPHSEHHFKSSAHGSVYLRKYVKGSDDSTDCDTESEDIPGSDGQKETSSAAKATSQRKPKFLVRTRYQYEFYSASDGKVGQLVSYVPRLPSGRGKPEHSLPVIEKITSVRTSLRKGASQTELQAVNFLPSPSDCFVSIHSPMVLDALRAVVSYYPGWGLRDGSLIGCKMDHILTFLTHHRLQLLEYQNEHPQTHSDDYIQVCNAHIDEVVRFLDSETDFLSKRLEDRMRGDDPTVTYDLLKALFKPGLEIYAWRGDQLRAYVVSSTTETSDKNEERFFAVVAWCISFDGTDLGRAAVTFYIKKFKDEQKVRSLPCFPSNLGPETWDGKSTRQRLIERGKKFFEICKGPSYMEITGFTRDLPKRKYSEARIICDASCEPWREATHRPNFYGLNMPRFEEDYKHARPLVGTLSREAFSSFPGCSCEDCQAVSGPAAKPHPYGQWDRIDRTLPRLEEHQYLMCSGEVFGYILKERQWRLLNVEDLERPEIEENLIDELVLEKEPTKKLIKAICSNYTSRDVKDTYSADFIQGKGEGNIFLLHGPPGVGKTLTAECVAEYTRRPLLPLTAGDIGSTAREVEDNLRKFLRRGQDWNAVVLLDEADVYLSARDRISIQRNSVISVFLREIEYYRGILFLTTNQIGQFDEAITSRVHISLHFKTFDPQSRKKVWENNLERLRKERKDIRVDYNVSKYVRNELLDLPWNGREIRNAFQTAVSLALFAARDENDSHYRKTGRKEKVADAELTTEHIQQVVEMSNDFKAYMSSTLDDDPAAIAKFNKIRNDEFEA